MLLRKIRRASTSALRQKSHITLFNSKPFNHPSIRYCSLFIYSLNTLIRYIKKRKRERKRETVTPVLVRMASDVFFFRSPLYSSIFYFDFSTKWQRPLNNYLAAVTNCAIPRSANFPHRWWKEDEKAVRAPRENKHSSWFYYICLVVVSPYLSQFRCLFFDATVAPPIARTSFRRRITYVRWFQRWTFLPVRLDNDVSRMAEQRKVALPYTENSIDILFR